MAIKLSIPLKGTSLKMLYSAYHQIVTICDFLGNFRKVSTKNTTKLENSSNSFLKFRMFFFWNFYCNYLVVDTVYNLLQKHWKKNKKIQKKDKHI